MTYIYYLVLSVVIVCNADGVDEDMALLEQLPEKVLEELRHIAAWLLCCECDTASSFWF